MDDLIQKIDHERVVSDFLKSAYCQSDLKQITKAWIDTQKSDQFIVHANDVVSEFWYNIGDDELAMFAFSNICTIEPLIKDESLSAWISKYRAMSPTYSKSTKVYWLKIAKNIVREICKCFENFSIYTEQYDTDFSDYLRIS